MNRKHNPWAALVYSNGQGCGITVLQEKEG